MLSRRRFTLLAASALAGRLLATARTAAEGVLTTP